jgi:hypothetical protein
MTLFLSRHVGNKNKNKLKIRMCFQEVRFSWE